MFVYEKKLQYPVKIKNTNPKLAALIISQYGGPYSHKLRKHLPQRVLSCNTAKTNERPPGLSFVIYLPHLEANSRRYLLCNPVLVFSGSREIPSLVARYCK